MKAVRENLHPAGMGFVLGFLLGLFVPSPLTNTPEPEPAVTVDQIEEVVEEPAEEAAEPEAPAPDAEPDDDATATTADTEDAP